MSDDSSNRTDVSTIHLDNISLQNRENVDSNLKFIGFDLSTQQVSFECLSFFFTFENFQESFLSPSSISKNNNNNSFTHTHILTSLNYSLL